jgi:hypothetical protein
MLYLGYYINIQDAIVALRTRFHSTPFRKYYTRQQQNCCTGCHRCPAEELPTRPSFKRYTGQLKEKLYRMPSLPCGREPNMKTLDPLSSPALP